MLRSDARLVVRTDTTPATPRSPAASTTIPAAPVGSGAASGPAAASRAPSSTTLAEEPRLAGDGVDPVDEPATSVLGMTIENTTAEAVPAGALVTRALGSGRAVIGFDAPDWDCDAVATVVACRSRLALAPGERQVIRVLLGPAEDGGRTGAIVAVSGLLGFLLLLVVLLRRRSALGPLAPAASGS